MKTLVHGGTVVTASDTFQADVLIEGEQIVAVGSNLEGSADTVIDATGMLVMPGGIDVHTHLDMPFGGTTSCDDFQTGHEAALAGGTTMHIDFSTQTRGETLQQGLDRWHAKAEGKAVADYSFHMIITDANESAIDEMGSLVDQGVTSFKLFLAYPNVLMVDDDTLFRVMRKAREVGALTMVHAENGPVIQQLIEQALADGQTDPKFHATTRPAEMEGEATSRAIALARLAEAPLFVVHVTCEDAVKAIAAARDEGADIHGETCVQYLYLTADDLARPGFEGAKFVCSPPLRTERDQHVLWQALRSGVLESVSTDHCPFNFAGQKELGKGDFSKIPNGIPGIGDRLFLLSEAVHQGHISWNQFVSLTSTTPARQFGLSGRKGTIAPGADADIVVWDWRATHTLGVENSRSAIDYNCYEGMQVRGRPSHVLSRGEVVVEYGQLTEAATPGRGRFVRRDRCAAAQLPNSRRVAALA